MCSIETHILSYKPAFLFLGYGYLHEASGLITFCIIALACTKEKEAI